MKTENAPPLQKEARTRQPVFLASQHSLLPSYDNLTADFSFVCSCAADRAFFLRDDVSFCFSQAFFVLFFPECQGCFL
jgi:hypothetical protein